MTPRVGSSATSREHLLAELRQADLLREVARRLPRDRPPADGARLLRDAMARLRALAVVSRVTGLSSARRVPVAECCG